MIHRFFLWLADLIDPGEWTATVAKLRLQDVIADDRAAVPCGRWVRNRSAEIAAYQAWTRNMEGPMMPDRPHYRWSERR